MARFSVIIPAHNEGAVIERCLKTLLSDAPAGEPEIIVVANGCTDDTAARARAVDARVKVIELHKGSKPLALNTGNAAATAVPRFFVDADIDVTYGSLHAAATHLAEGRVHAAAPAIELDLAGASLPVRLFHDIWMRLPYVNRGLVGAGVYGLSAEGLKRVGTFPDIVGDDLYVISKFATEERASVRAGPFGAARFIHRPPKSLAMLLKIEARRRAGDEEMKELFGHPTTDSLGTGAALARLASRPWLWPGIALYVFVKAESRRRYGAAKRRGAHKAWSRDETTRTS